jgi:hypothetical protein
MYFLFNHDTYCYIRKIIETKQDKTLYKYSNFSIGGHFSTGFKDIKNACKKWDFKNLQPNFKIK